MRKRLAKFLAKWCFRNTGLENLHAGRVPHSKAGDYTDVKVVAPDAEIPWNELSRFSDEEVKRLMIDVVNKTYTWLTMLFCSDQFAATMLDALEKADVHPEWNEPELNSEVYSRLAPVREQSQVAALSSRWQRIKIIWERAKELHPEARPRIISDHRPQFIAKNLKEFIRVSGMTHPRTSPYYPQSNE